MAPKIKVVVSRNHPDVDPIVRKERSNEIPFEILDQIFSLLKSNPKALLACSQAHPTFSQIAEKYRFRHIIIHTGLTTSKFPCSFSLENLQKELAETPRIAQYVAVLQIEFNFPQHPTGSTCMLASFWNESAPVILNAYLEQIALLLPTFPLLECIILPTLTSALRESWQGSQAFRTALDNCLRLPTLREIHVGDMSFPLSMLDNHANITYLALSGPPKYEPDHLEAAYYPIKSLALERFELPERPTHRPEAFRVWTRRHIVGLQSLTYDYSCPKILRDVFMVCSNSLENLHLYFHRQGKPEDSELINLSNFPHLRNLTIHAEIYSCHYRDLRFSYLPLAAETLETASPTSSLHQLTIEIYIDSDGTKPESVSLSELNFLAETSVDFQHIDLYVFTASPWDPITHAIMGSMLAKQKGLMKLIEQGVLVVHPEQTAPPSSRSYVAREDNNTLSFMEPLLKELL